MSEHARIRRQVQMAGSAEVLKCGMGRIKSAKAWARRIKRDVVALWIAARDSRTPLLAKVVAGCIAAYALSPIDLIPDFIPVLGFVDDLVFVPAGIILAVRLIPSPLMEEFRRSAEQRLERPVSGAGLLFIAAIWLAVSAWVCWLMLSRTR